MAKLIDDIDRAANWLVKAFASVKIDLDFSVESMQHIERLIDEQFHEGRAVPDGFFADQLGAKVFAIGSYLGEVIVQSVTGAEWKTDDSDPRGEINIQVVANGTEIYPVHRIIKRMKEGKSANVHDYAASLVAG